tara:strand:- start:789 stop:1586 length:798 start_codon:yes stop_codon:yes gene_type:complete
MAINVDTVYRTVLLVLNKENRGYITPDEFNKTATQVQLDIFEQYFDDLNQQLRVPQRSSDYADRQRAIEQKLAPFKGYGTCIYTGVSSPVSVNDKTFAIPVIDGRGNTVVNDGSEPDSNTKVAFYKLGTVFYENSDTLTSEIQLVTRGEYNSLNKSNLTAPSLFSPISMYEDYRLKVAPSTITAGLYASFIRKPRNVVWNFTVDSSNNNAYSWDATNSTNFELLQSEQTEVIVKILLYSGVVIKDYQVVQLAAQSVQGKEINQKS